MPAAKTPRTTKPRVSKKVLQMPEATNGNGSNSADTELQDQIRLRAYELYAQRGFTNGHSDEDWLQAEREVLARHGQQEHTA
jgi:hypothetical protein